jgi:hypothetical protein
MRAGLNTFQSPPRISFKGSKFHSVFDGTETLLTRTVDGHVEPLTFLNVVVVDANAGKYKLFYGELYDDGVYRPKAYEPDTEPTAPTCYSLDGIRPSPFAEVKQCETCAACPHNVFGSHVTQNGSETRACSDNKLLAVLPQIAVDKQLDPKTKGGTMFMVKVPPTGLSRNKDDRKADPTNNTSLSEYVKLLDRFPTGDGGEVEVPMSAVVTRLFFDHHAEYPLPRFKLSSFLTPEQIAYVNNRRLGDDCKAIVTEELRSGATPAPAPAPTPAPALAAPVPAPAPTPAPAPAAAAPARPAPAPRASAAPRPAVVPPAPAQAAAPAADPDAGAWGGEDNGAAPAPAQAAPQPAAAAPAAPRRGRPSNAARAQAAPAQAAPRPAPAPAQAAPATPPPAQVVSDPDLDGIAGMFG